VPDQHDDALAAAAEDALLDEERVEVVGHKGLAADAVSVGARTPGAAAGVAGRRRRGVLVLVVIRERDGRRQHGARQAQDGARRRVVGGCDVRGAGAVGVPSIAGVAAAAAAIAQAHAMPQHAKVVWVDIVWVAGRRRGAVVGMRRAKRLAARRALGQRERADLKALRRHVADHNRVLVAEHDLAALGGVVWDQRHGCRLGGDGFGVAVSRGCQAVFDARALTALACQGGRGEVDVVVVLVVVVAVVVANACTRAPARKTIVSRPAQGSHYATMLRGARLTLVCSAAAALPARSTSGVCRKGWDGWLAVKEEADDDGGVVLQGDGSSSSRGTQRHKANPQGRTSGGRGVSRASPVRPGGVASAVTVVELA
jgi:hypothetical protein